MILTILFQLMTKRERIVLKSLIKELSIMCRPGLMLDMPDDPTYEPILVKESDLGAFHLPRLEEIMGYEQCQ